MQICPFCKTELPDDSIKCSGCGARHGYLIRKTVQQKPWLMVRLFVWIGIAVVCLLGGYAVTAALAKIPLIAMAIFAVWKAIPYGVLLRKKARWWRRT